MINAGILTISDKGAKGEREDKSGEKIRRLLTEAGINVKSYEIIPDDQGLISQKLIDWVDNKKLDLILTTGGTGLSPRDLTPEATREVLEKELPGIAEAIRWEGLKSTSRAMLSRGMAGTRGYTLIINLPGSPQAVNTGLSFILPTLPHALEKLKGDPSECAN
ncbi:MAG: MogA/MoaB family molybdenum cofactor biosynthesis protein [Deltaproteobacteria bacterium]|nr:MAG: MogA/MoaB family molybdenum cofactor biosynthesis protein [Deltaproteobacteria bacterium]